MNRQTARRVEVLLGHLEGLSTLPLIPDFSHQKCFSVSSRQHEGYVQKAGLRKMLDGTSVNFLDLTFKIFEENKVFHLNVSEGSKVFSAMNYNSTMEEQREVTFKRILFIRDLGLLDGYLTSDRVEVLRQKAAIHEAIGIFDHSMAVKLGVHIHLWGGAVKYLGTKRHHEKYLKRSECYEIAGCFGLTELGHGSNVRGIETVATYDVLSGNFLINTPTETSQKYWIGGAAKHANHCVVFAQLHINGRNEGVHAFVVPIRDFAGNPIPGIRIADCGHKIGLNGADNGRIWFNNVPVPRENLLNAVADVTPEGKYESAISDPDQRFAALMAPLTGGRVTIAVSAVNQCKVGLSIALRYALTRRAFSSAAGEEETLLLDYPSHQRRLLPLLAKTYALNFACNALKELYLTRKPSDTKQIHVQSSSLKAMASWHMLRTLQECREACGGQGVASVNRIGQLKAEHDVMATFEGDNNVLMQTVSKAILADYLSSKKRGIQRRAESSHSWLLSSAWDISAFRSPEFQVDLFRLREADLLERFSVEVGKLTAGGVPLSAALVQSYQLATNLGIAHAEREILEAMVSALKTSPSFEIHETLSLLCTLFSAVTVDEDPVFLRYNYVSTLQAQNLHRLVAELCAEIKPHALTLVEGFGIPDHLLGPIAVDWVEYNSWRNV